MNTPDEPHVLTCERQEQEAAKDADYRGGLVKISGQWFDSIDVPSWDEL
jgi:hypothetical protein